MKRLLIDYYNLLENLTCFLENNLPGKFTDNEEFLKILTLRDNMRRSIKIYLDSNE
jgi:hypothetical protein